MKLAFALLIFVSTANVFANEDGFHLRADKEGIRNVFYAKAKDFRKCYEDQLKKNPKLAGKITFDFDIQPDGSVAKNAKILQDRSTLKDENTHKCLLEELKKSSFPKTPEKKIVNVIYPMGFSAK